MGLVTNSADPSFDWTAEFASAAEYNSATERTGDLLRFATRVKDEVASNGGGRAQLWMLDVNVGDDERLMAAGFRPYRDLWKMQVPLPAVLSEGYSPVEVRPYDAGDEEEFLYVNSRAFAWHPEQGRLTSEELHKRFAEPWYDPKGFLVLEIDGRIAGFCWTKVHEEPPTGEIYAIAVDPDFAGRRLGLPLTYAGLTHLMGVGQNTAILYVESDNAPAVKIYRKLGFGLHQVNRAYEATVELAD